MSDRARARGLILLVLLLGAGACIRGTLPARELYRLDPPVTAEPVEAGEMEQPLSGALAVAPYLAPGIYADAPIAYRIGETQYGTYPSREWALPLSVMMGLLTQSVLREQPLSDGPAIYDPASDRTTAYVWRGTIREFEEVNRGDQVYAAVAFDVQLVRAADDSVLWMGSARREELVAAPTMPNIVSTLSALAATSVRDLAAQARLALDGAPSAAVLPK